MLQVYFRRIPLISIAIWVLVFLIQPKNVFADTAGWALGFNGSTNHVSLGDTGTLLGSSDWASNKTFEVWVKVTGNTSPVTPPTSGELLFGNDRPRLFGLTRAVYTGRDSLCAWNIDANGADIIRIPFTPGEWTHIAIIHSDGVLSVYQDGVLVNSIPSGTTAVPSPGTDGYLYLGGSGRSDPNLYFEGELDEVRFWNAALDAETLSGWRDISLTSSHPYWGALRAYYAMSDGSGTLLSDDSDNSFIGQLLGGMNAASWVVSGVIFRSLSTNTATQVPADTGTATPTATSSSTSTATATSTISPTATATPAVETTATGTATETATPSGTPEATTTGTASPTAAATLTPTATELATYTPSSTPIGINTPTQTPMDVQTATATLPTTGTLVEVGFFDTPGYAYDLAIAGSIAYIADVTHGMRVVDISDPTNPREIGAFIGPNRGYGIDVQGSYAYLTDSRDGLLILDISNPSTPFLTAMIDTPSYAWEVDVSGDYAFVADRWGGLRIINISNPYSPFEVASAPTQDEALDVVIQGSYAYVASYGAGMIIFDIADPSRPLQLGRYQSTRDYGLEVNGSLAYLADGGTGLLIVDTSNPAAPQLLSREDTPGWSRALCVAGGVVYLADWTNDLVVINVENSLAPYTMLDLDLIGSSRDVAHANGYIYVAAYEGGLRVLQWR